MLPLRKKIHVEYLIIAPSQSNAIIGSGTAEFSVHKWDYEALQQIRKTLKNQLTESFEQGEFLIDFGISCTFTVFDIE